MVFASPHTNGCRRFRAWNRCGGIGLILVSLILAAGCKKEAEAPKPTTILPLDWTEPSFAEQLALVRAGETDRIYLIKEQVGDDQLQQLGELTALRELLLDESAVTAKGIGELAKLPHLEHLRLRGNKLDDDALQAAAKIKSLRVLNLPHGNFTDAGVQQLRELPNLVQLRLGSEQLTDQALAAMMSFPALLRIHLLQAPITDAGLQAVHSNHQLESLYLDDSKITEQGLRDLFAALPELHVHINQAHADNDPHKNDHVH